MEAWEKFLLSLDEALGVEQVNKWVRALKVVRFDAGNLYLEAQDPFQALWYDEHVKKRVQRSFVNNNSRKIKVHLAVANAADKKKTKKTKTPEIVPQKSNSYKLTFDSLDPYCTFTSFCHLECNNMAFQVLAKQINLTSQAGIAQVELEGFNPVYLHGGVGTGKTHLLMAIAEELRRQGRRVLYCNAQTFTDHVVSAIRAGEMRVFREAYRNNDILLVDDVHVFSRKGATQEEFFHTFNTLHLSGKQIILSANCSPKELSFIEPRLVSRFEWGIVLPLEIPGFDEAKTILQAKCKAMHFCLHEKVVNFLCATFATTKGIIKALEAIVLRSHLDKKLGNINPTHLTITHVEHLIADLLKEEKEYTLTAEGIVEHIAKHFSIEKAEVIGKSQKREYVLPRQLAMFFCRKMLKLPYLAIGSVFSRDHSTVMSSIKSIEKGVAAHLPDIAIPVRAITNSLKQRR